MSVVTIQSFGGEAVSRAEKLLAGISGGVEKAVRSALPRAASSLRSEAVKEIRKKYDISAENIRARHSVSVKYTYGANNSATVRFSGKKIPLHRYNGTSPVNPEYDSSKTVIAIINGINKPVHPGVTASAHQLKGTSPKKIPGAFVAKMKSGHIGIFERTGGVTSSGSDEIRELKGSSVPQMLGSEEVAAALGKHASDVFEQRMEHEITRILNGWGGNK
ncbi:MAG: phage tail protein [Lachnospiraceae bacterium]|nr:phage tail protein [Lachnospiraceae bacterium]